ncbi:LuxR C-terminal-related transcriptional regulator [Catenuloplanes atrovinosus]|uniref:DNA-binding CsgD family transcriptional regulator n=1 Tax=Catenuloplanes atrovinosus TaxID=137266 RepID=A0AAE4C8W6_9ACTN|nr:LuxR C-terminal-related transcriptional regulator [Catenuloplanes atrovinosus]MDR7275428.1 DNA-binding CsgD family transcriptional regulator [Catenuloplanes atrovinosus]
MRFQLDRTFRDRPQPHRADAHRAYWRRRSLHGWTWADTPGETLIVEAHDRAALTGLLAGDPYTRAGLVTHTAVRPLGEPVTTPDRTQPHPVRDDRSRPPVRTISSRPDRLSPHEWRVARMMLDGLTNRQIADRLAVSPRAIEQHITRIYRKLSIDRRAQLALALHGHPGEPSPVRGGTVPR